MNLLYPTIKLGWLPAILSHMALGSICAGIFGVAHDQITYSISPEYFTKLKFLQFHWADFGFLPRVFVAEIGFLATWWVGLIAGWFIARNTVPGSEPRSAFRRTLQGFSVMFGTATTASLVGYWFGIIHRSTSDLSGWEDFGVEYAIQDLPNFVRVAYIHNASYLGGLVGLIAAILFVRRTKLPDTNSA